MRNQDDWLDRARDAADRYSDELPDSGPHAAGPVDETEQHEEQGLPWEVRGSGDRRDRSRGREKFRRQIIVEAARLMYRRHEKEYYRAKLKAARTLCGGWVKPSDLPSNAEIRDEIQRMANLFETSGDTECLYRTA